MDHQDAKARAKERPILFSGAMVRAILAGTKTQTRRIGKFQRDDATELGVEYCVHATRGTIAQATYRAYPTGGSARGAICECPYGIPGTQLWVRETHSVVHPLHGGTLVEYRADESPFAEIFVRWTPSIHMPRWASRITLEIIDLRVERLNDISEEDAWAEGCKRGEPTDNGGFFPAEEPDPSGIGMRGWDSPIDWYADLWEAINGPASWDRNPWVWVIEFARAGSAEGGVSRVSPETARAAGGQRREG